MPIQDDNQRHEYNKLRYQKLIDPKTKLFGVCKGWALSSERFWAEVAKCQLLCRKHHEEKTKTDGSVASFTHGRMYAWMKIKCDCLDCLSAKDEYYALRRANRNLSLK